MGGCPFLRGSFIGVRDSTLDLVKYFAQSFVVLEGKTIFVFQYSDGGDVAEWRRVQDGLLPGAPRPPAVLGVREPAGHDGHPHPHPSLHVLEEN